MNASIAELVGGEADWLKEFAAYRERIAESLWQDAHDFSRFASDSQRPADNVAVTPEPLTPGVVAQNRNSASTRILFGNLKGPAEQGLDPKGLEKTSGHSRRW